MDNKFEPLSGGEVLSVNDSLTFLIGHNTFRAGELAEALRSQLLEHSIGGLTEDKDGWFTEEGINCEVLRFGARGWQKGKVRINLEFCPAEWEAEETEQFIDEDDLDIEEDSPSSEAETIIEENAAFEPEPDLAASFPEEEEPEPPPIALGEISESEDEPEPDLATSFPEEEEPSPIPLGGISEFEPEPDLMASFPEEEEPSPIPLGGISELELELPEEPFVELEKSPAADQEGDVDLAGSFSQDEDDLDLAELESSIEEELELVETSEKDEEFDLAKIEQDNEGFDFANISGEKGTEEKNKEQPVDNLFDDVWQDIN